MPIRILDFDEEYKKAVDSSSYEYIKDAYYPITPKEIPPPKPIKYKINRPEEFRDFIFNNFGMGILIRIEFDINNKNTIIHFKQKTDGIDRQNTNTLFYLIPA